MRNVNVFCAICVICGLLLSGCGNVYLSGQALTACQTSAMDAYNASQAASGEASGMGVPPMSDAGVSPARAEGILPSEYPSTQPASQSAPVPPWVQAYLQENYKQWRSFVRSATKDDNWGPKLQGE